MLNQNVVKTQYAVTTCDHAQSAQLWYGCRKLWGKPPRDLALNIVRTFQNPITGTTMKRHRHININNLSVSLRFGCNIKNGAETPSEQFKNFETQLSKYSLYGVANHEGIASSGHYTNHILNDSEDSPKNKWVHTDSLRVIYHNDDNRISENVTTCWFTRDLNN